MYGSETTPPPRKTDENSFLARTRKKKILLKTLDQRRIVLYPDNGDERLTKSYIDNVWIKGYLEIVKKKKTNVNDKPDMRG